MSKKNKAFNELSDWELDQLDFQEAANSRNCKRKATKGKKAKFGKRDFDLLETSFANG